MKKWKYYSRFLFFLMKSPPRRRRGGGYVEPFYWNDPTAGVFQSRETSSPTNLSPTSLPQAGRLSFSQDQTSAQVNILPLSRTVVSLRAVRECCCIWTALESTVPFPISSLPRVSNFFFSKNKRRRRHGVLGLGLEIGLMESRHLLFLFTTQRFG